MDLNPYEDLFKQEVSANNKGQLDQINNFLQMLIPYANSGEEPDLQDLALKVDIPYENALELPKVVVRGRK